MTPARFLAILLAVMLTLPVPFALADDDDGDDEEDRDRDRDEDGDEDRERGGEHGKRGAARAGEAREVRVLMEEGRAVLKYEQRAGDAEDELTFTVVPREGVVRLKYEAESGTGETEYGLRVLVRTVFEYVDGNANGRFDPEADTVVSRYRAEHMDWSFTDVTDATFGGRSAKAFAASAPLGASGTFTLRFLAAGDFAEEGAVSLRPTDLKFDIGITDYPFEANDTLVGVETRVSQEFERERALPAARGDGEDVVVVETGDTDLYFAWADTVMVDGVERPVTATVTEAKSESKTEEKDGETETESKSEKRVFLSYPRGAEILHDPVVGLQSAEAEEKPMRTPAAPALLVASVATAAALVARRRRHAQ